MTLIPNSQPLFKGCSEVIPETEEMILNSQLLGNKGKSMDFGFGFGSYPLGAAWLRVSLFELLILHLSAQLGNYPLPGAIGESGVQAVDIEGGCLGTGGLPGTWDTGELRAPVLTSGSWCGTWETRCWDFWRDRAGVGEHRAGLPVAQRERLGN